MISVAGQKWSKIAGFCLRLDLKRKIKSYEFRATEVYKAHI